MGIIDRRTGAGRTRRNRSFVAVYLVLLVAYSVYVLLDTFVIVHAYASASSATVAATISEAATSDDASSDDGVSYSAHGSTGTSDTADSGAAGSSNQDSSSMSTSAEASTLQASTTGTSGVSTSLSELRYLDTTVYVVDVYADDPTSILAAFAQDTYGRNVTAATSEIASSVGASVAINGDYYGTRRAGYVVRNGVLWRDTAASADQEDLVIYQDGSWAIVREGDVTAQELVDAGAWQVFSFGPGLVIDGQVAVDEDDEVGHAMASNPRTALAKVSDGHYVLVVSDGRTSESEGLSLAELASFLVDELGVECAYNLDGGGSSTLYYEGRIANNPTTNGNRISERSVSDIVYLVAS
jgi:exopolysaccharide biosynthesis protein